MDIKDSLLVVYGGISGVRIHIRVRVATQLLAYSSERKRMMIYRGLNVDCFSQEVNRCLSLTVPII